jgi:glycosyltransferase involved in cell wall biosynthesis
LQPDLTETMKPNDPRGPHRTAIALVYWGRLGAGAALMTEIATAMQADPRFDVFASTSRQSELPGPLATDRLLAIDTFSSLPSLLLGTMLLPLTVRRLVRKLTRARVQAIVTVMPHVWGLALQRAVRRAGIRTLIIVHDADPHPGERRPLFDWLVRQEIGEADRIVTLSSHVADRLLARDARAAHRLTRLFHPVFRFTAGRAAEPRPRKPFRLLFFGRILPYKGVPLLLEAYARLRALEMQVVLQVSGRGDIAAPRALLRQAGLYIDQGWVPPEAIGAMLADADAVVLPYLEASQSGVIAAAYGAGLPVVATPVGGLVEQVIDGHTGVIAADTTASELAGAIGRLIETPGLYARCRAGVAEQAIAQSPGQFARALGDAVIATISGPA